MTATRLFLSMLGAAGITFALFWIMTALVVVEGAPEEPEPFPTIEIVKVRPDHPPESKVRRPKPVLQKVVHVPTQPAPPDSQPGGPGRLVFEPLDPRSGREGRRGLRDLMPADGAAVPLVRVEPRYPERALARGLEGRVLVEFTIGRSGAVSEARVIASEPPGVFDAAALEAVRQWRYTPRVVDGEPVQQRGLRIAIPFRRAGGSA